MDRVIGCLIREYVPENRHNGGEKGMSVGRVSRRNDMKIEIGRNGCCKFPSDIEMYMFRPFLSYHYTTPSIYYIIYYHVISYIMCLYIMDRYAMEMELGR